MELSESGTDLVKLSFLKKRTAAVCAQRAHDFLLKSTAIYNNVSPFLTESFAAGTESSQAALQANL